MVDVTAQVSASLDALTREFDVIAHNLANADTAGFKRRCNVFSQMLDSQMGNQDGGETNPVPQGAIDFSQGHLVQTDRSLDLALHGDGFFVIETPDGPLYTRHGIFQTNQNGQLVDTVGRVVAGVAGPISLPANVDPSAVQILHLFAKDAEIAQAAVADRFAVRAGRLVRDVGAQGDVRGDRDPVFVSHGQQG